VTAGGGADVAWAGVVVVEDEVGGDAGRVEVVVPDVRTVAARTESGDGNPEGGLAPELPPNTQASTLPGAGSRLIAPDWLYVQVLCPASAYQNAQ
jgi:hypothetical protein